MINCVGSGNCAPKDLNARANCGTTRVMITPTATATASSTISGYRSAAVIFLRVFASKLR